VITNPTVPNLVGPTIGHVRDVHLGQYDVINGTACPAGLPSPEGFVTLGWIFEPGERDHESSEVKFDFLNDNSGVLAGAWLRFPCS